MTASLLFFALSALSLLLLIYPYVIYPAILRGLPKRPIVQKPSGHTLSLLFCAYNEERSIDLKLQNLRELKARMPELEILAFDDGSQDSTRERLSKAADILTLVPGKGRQGKASGMKNLARLATGDVLVFTDANVLLRPDALENLLPYYGDESVGGVCGSLLYVDADTSPTAAIGAQYWSLDERLRSLEAETGNVMGADGSIFSIRRSLYPEFPDSELDDFVVSLSTVFAGRRLVKAPDVIAFENSVAKPDEEFRRKIRIGTRAYHSHQWMRVSLRKMHALDRFKYVSRKYLRWFGGAFLIAGVVFALLGLAIVWPSAAMVAALAGALVTFGALKMQSGPLAKAADVLRALIGTMIGVSRGMRGQVVQTWSPAQSR